jgi:stalled ribosome alternative rescue factor ArfA
MEVEMKTRNNVARNAWKFNKPKAYRAKKGKGSYIRTNKVKFDELLSCGM